MIRSTVVTFSTCLAFISMVAQAAGHDKTQFDQLKERLLSGKPTISIVTLEQCTLKSGGNNAKSGVVGGIKIGAFLIQSLPKASISYANKHFTITEDGTPVIEFMQYRILLDDTATFKVTRLSPMNFRPLSEQKVFDCPLGTGLRFFTENSTALE